MAAAAATKVALVTASAAGLGAATVRTFAKEGYHVVINYNSSAEKAQALAKEISSSTSSSEQKPRCLVAQADVSDRKSITSLVQRAVEEFGRIDVVVSNQGWTQMRNFNDLEDNVNEDDWDRCWNMNVKSHLWLFHETKPWLIKSEGCFTTVASLAGVEPSGSSVPYAVSKAAQIYLVKTLAKTGPKEIRINSVAPGIIMTEWGRRFPEEKLKASREKTTLKRMVEVDDVVLQILHFAKSRSVTGTNAVIDAGWSLN